MQDFNTTTEIAIYLAGGFNGGVYEEYAQIQHQLNYELNYGVLVEDRI